MCILNQNNNPLWLEPLSKEKTFYPENGKNHNLDFLVDHLNDETMLDNQNPTFSVFEGEINNDLLFGSYWIFISLFVTFGKWFFFSRFISQPVEISESSKDGSGQTESTTSENVTQSANFSRDIPSTGGGNSGGNGDDPFSNKGSMAGSHYTDYVSFLDWLLDENADTLSTNQVDWLVQNGANYGLIIQFDNSARTSVILPWTSSLLSVERPLSGTNQTVVYSKRNDRPSEFSLVTRDREKVRNNILGILNGTIRHVGTPADLFSEAPSQENSGESAHPSNGGNLLPIVVGLIGSVFAARASGFQFPQRRRSQSPQPSGIIPSEALAEDSEDSGSYNGLTTLFILICTTIFGVQIRRNRGPNPR